MTVVGWNHLQESDEFLVTFEMVGQVRGMVMEADWDLVHSGKFSSLK